MVLDGKLICSKCKERHGALWETETDLTLAKQGHGAQLCRECVKTFPLFQSMLDGVTCDACGEEIDGKVYKVDDNTYCESCLFDRALWAIYNSEDYGLVYERDGVYEEA